MSMSQLFKDAGLKQEVVNNILHRMHRSGLFEEKFLQDLLLYIKEKEVSLKLNDEERLSNAKVVIYSNDISRAIKYSLESYEAIDISIASKKIEKIPDRFILAFMLASDQCETSDEITIDAEVADKYIEMAKKAGIENPVDPRILNGDVMKTIGIEVFAAAVA